MKIQRHFTIFELLISVALLAMLTVVLLRMFAATSDLWSASDEQSRLYADAQTAFAILSDDLSNVVYQNDSICEQAGTSDVTAPLWLEKYPLGNFGSVTPITSYNSYGGNHSAAMHFITRNSFLSKNETATQNGFYEVSYRCLPATNDADETWSYAGKEYAPADGALLRSTRDCEKLINPGRTASTHMSTVFPADHTFKQVITGVLDFQILAYQHVESDDWNKTQPPIELEDGDSLGAENVETIQIVLQLMPPERIPELRNLLDRNNNDAEADEVKEYLFKYSRTFRKTFRIRTRIGDEE